MRLADGQQWREIVMAHANNIRGALKGVVIIYCRGKTIGTVSYTRLRAAVARSRGLILVAVILAPLQGFGRLIAAFESRELRAICHSGSSLATVNGISD